MFCPFNGFQGLKITDWSSFYAETFRAPGRSQYIEWNRQKIKDNWYKLKIPTLALRIVLHRFFFKRVRVRMRLSFRVCACNRNTIGRKRGLIPKVCINAYILKYACIYYSTCALVLSFILCDHFTHESIPHKRSHVYKHVYIHKHTHTNVRTCGLTHTLTLILSHPFIGVFQWLWPRWSTNFKLPKLSCIYFRLCKLFRWSVNAEKPWNSYRHSII